MNAAYNETITTSAKTVFLSSDVLGADGFDITTCTRIYVYNHDTSINLLVKIDGHHDAVSNAPTGYGTVTPAANQWAVVPPGMLVPFDVAKDTPNLDARIKKMQLKAASGSISASWYVGQRR